MFENINRGRGGGDRSCAGRGAEGSNHPYERTVTAACAEKNKNEKQDLRLATTFSLRPLPHSDVVSQRLPSLRRGVGCPRALKTKSTRHAPGEARRTANRSIRVSLPASMSRCPRAVHRYHGTPERPAGLRHLWPGPAPAPAFFFFFSRFASFVQGSETNSKRIS